MQKTQTEIAEEIADVIFSTVSIANLFEIQIEQMHAFSQAICTRVDRLLKI